MNVRLRTSSLARRCGFTLAETVIAVGVLGLFVMACFTTISFSRVTSTKAKQEAIAMDFLAHYAELVRALPFNYVNEGNPINPLLDGSGASPDIRIPSGNDWVALNTDDYEAFHPDLIWMHNLNPKMRVTVTTERVGGVPRSKYLNLRVAWDAPLGRGGRLEQQLDLIRVNSL